LQLKTYVSDPSLISFANTSLQSDTKLAATTIIGNQKNLLLINPRNPSEKLVNQISAESVVPHKKKNIVAVKRM
jgi:hypothetical protein